jgi:hypothetical protein
MDLSTAEVALGLSADRVAQRTVDFPDGWGASRYGRAMDELIERFYAAFDRKDARGPRALHGGLSRRLTGE